MKSSKYTESIIFLGLVLPLLVLGALLGGIFYFKNNLGEQFAQKKEDYVEYEEALKNAKEAEAALGTRGDSLEAWKEHLAREFTEELNKNLNAARDGVEEAQLSLTSLSRPSASGGLAGASDNAFDRFQITFEGGYESMEKVALGLERRMPQLLLESIKLEPASGSGLGSSGRVSFSLTYVAWSDPVKN